MTEFKMGDLVTYRDSSRTPTHALVLEVFPEGETLRITRGSAHECMTELQETMVKPGTLGAGVIGLHRRLAHSINQAAKLLEDKDREAQDCIDMLREANQVLAGKLADIRKWMINQTEDGGLSREDLDGFLEEFGLEPYAKRYKVAMTVIVTVEVDRATDEDDATDQATEWVEANLKGHSLPDGVKFHGDDGTDFVGYDVDQEGQ